MGLVELKYIDLVSSKLNKFKKVKTGLYNFRCPICGDSRKNKNRARGYLYTISGNINFKCHNCGENISFKNFLKTIDNLLYTDYCFEKFLKKNRIKKDLEIDNKVKTLIKTNLNIDLPLASYNNISNEYLIQRKLNPNKFYYCKEFKKWINSKKPYTFNDKSLNYEEERIIIPLIYNKKLVGVQGRSLIAEHDPKYITIMFDDDAPKIYNYDNIDNTKNVYIVEGAFDCEFIKNSIAMCGADLNVDDLNICYPIWIYDNEPRNSEIIHRIETKIKNGESVVIWPTNINEKDINDMIKNGLNVENIIKENIYSNIKANLQFNYWKRK